jgi:hypothetical protein
MAGLLAIAGIIYTLRLDRLERTDQVSVSVHARSQFRGRFCSGMIAPGGGEQGGWNASHAVGQRFRSGLSVPCRATGGSYAAIVASSSTNEMVGP